jgi:GDSL-like Lipase/Acylhydrolase family
MHRIRLLLAALACAAGVAMTFAGTSFAAGTIVFDGSPGTGAPPPTLGPYTMTPFPADPRPLFDYVADVPGPTGAIGLSPLAQHVRVEQGWNTWSNGYLGDVYWSGALTNVITLPPGTSAFYFYAEPNPYAVFTITAFAQDGTTSGPVSVDGFHGAQYFGFYGLGGATITSILVSSPIDYALGEFGISSGAVPHGSYVALGDSYSSGEGNPPFFAGTDGPSDYCHRSPLAFSYVLASIYGSFPFFYACSGATTANFTTTPKDTEPPQLSEPGVDASAALVTFTIGGNDAGFSHVLKACIEQKLKADFINSQTGIIGGWLGLHQDPSCAHSDTFTSSVDTAIDNAFWPVKLTEIATLSVVDPANTSVIAADYPLLFPPSHDDQGCLALRFILTNDDMDWMNVEGGRLDAVLQQAAGEAGVNFVDVRPAFAGHAICDTNGSYLNALSTASGGGGACTWSVAGHCIIPGLPIIGSFHPNAAGHANGYGAAFAGYIASATVRTSHGFPANPVPLPDPPSVPNQPQDGFADLAVHPVTAGSPDCSDTYQAGQQVTVSGDGFQPGTPVQLYASSPGLGDTGEALVAATTANDAGEISLTVRVPLAAAGFTQPGAAAGMAFFDAIGLGFAANHQDDVAMIGLAAHGSECGTIEPLNFVGFTPPVANPPAVNPVEPGRSVPVKFSIAGSNGTLASVLAPGYPQSLPVSCSAPGEPTTGDPTTTNATASTLPADTYNYVWKTDSSWRGCRLLIVKLVDGSYHRAVFDFGT